ncbi:MAG TPA: ABC transporter [Myxococcales bacterium]|nr:ABC transporter [Deltaproteobacteria bacterium]MBU54167.1 ABC transporter [Deltaproteobacteria bacterium]HAA54584.1 ABC transporter [Myxococcales bacterium]
MDTLMQVQNISRQLGQRWLWRALHFQLSSGEQLAIVGRSGSGKSQLLRVLAGLLPFDEGDILFQGRSQSQWQMPLYRTKVLYFPQQTTLTEGTVEEALMRPFSLTLHKHREYSKAWVTKTLDILKKPTTFLRSQTQQLSGGERQIVQLMRGLQLDPNILLLDEPTASLDPETSMQVEAWIQTWCLTQPERACIWISHNEALRSRMNMRTFHLPSKDAS